MIIPPPSTEEFEVGVSKDAADAWIVDGEKWHLERRCKAKGKQILLSMIEGVAEHISDAHGPTWSQKHYVSIRLGNAIWLYLITRANQLNLAVPVPPGPVGE